MTIVIVIKKIVSSEAIILTQRRIFRIFAIFENGMSCGKSAGFHQGQFEWNNSKEKPT